MFYERISTRPEDRSKIIHFLEGKGEWKPMETQWRNSLYADTPLRTVDLSEKKRKKKKERKERKKTSAYTAYPKKMHILGFVPIS